jgi:hypothetical protein
MVQAGVLDDAVDALLASAAGADQRARGLVTPGSSITSPLNVTT